TAHVWDLATGEESLVLRGRSPAERAIRFTPDGSQIHFRGVLQPLPTTAEGLLKAGCELLAREGEIEPVRASCAPFLAGK
ncbi:MAG: hypothetical protein HOV80_12975, partial [Polyangiaceae bacterium]|nr:hypothetical protein [Polyangiaceae bacterium]